MATLSDKMATKEKLDLEAQLPLRSGQSSSSSSPSPPGAVDNEYQVSGWTKVYYLAIYFLCNISLTIYNKLILGKVRHYCSYISIHRHVIQASYHRFTPSR